MDLNVYILFTHLFVSRESTPVYYYAITDLKPNKSVALFIVNKKKEHFSDNKFIAF